MSQIVSDKSRDVPILFIFFNRPDHTRKVFDVLKKLQPSRLFIAADGPRVDRPLDMDACKESRKIATQIDWQCDLQTRFLEQNLGCKLAVSSAITWFFENVEEGIILEDDCVPNFSFFHFCAEMLERYREDERVMQISGNNFLPIEHQRDATYYFSALNDIWGWATWRRAWVHFDLTMPHYVEFKELKLLDNFIVDKEISRWLGSYLDEAFIPECSVWSSQWTYSMIRQNAMTIVPSMNLVRNIGFDSAGTHSSMASWNYYDKFELHSMDDITHPNFMIIDREADRLRFDVIRKTDPRCFSGYRLRVAVISLIPPMVRKLIKKIIGYVSRNV